MSDDKQQNKKARLERLRGVVAAYGADRARWPEHDRSDFTDADMADQAVASDIGEAQALDALLAHASIPAPMPDTAAKIAARIIAADRKDKVVDMKGHQPSLQHTASRHASFYWPAAGLLAASLMIGIFLGQSDIFANTIDGSFLTADASIDELGNLFLGLPLDPALLAEETL